MFSLGAISFVSPWLLLALVGLPALWWLLRITPPAPAQIAFPPVRLLMKIISHEESAARSPLWIIILRLSIIAAIILGASHPLWNAAASLDGRGPFVIVVNDSWASAVDWPARQSRLSSLVEQAGREERLVLLITTAPTETQGKSPPLEYLSPSEARKVVARLQPKPWHSDLGVSQKRLKAFSQSSLKERGHVFWLSDGLKTPGTMSFLETLRSYGRVTFIMDAPSKRAMILNQPLAKGDVLEIEAVRPHKQGTDLQWVRAVGEDGGLLTRESFIFSSDKHKATIALKLPTELRNKLSRIELERQTTAGSIILLDERWRRRPVGLVDRAGVAARQPLLHELYYLERALNPFTEVRKESLENLLRRELAILILADTGGLQKNEKEKFQAWIKRGGILVRFSGPRLASNPDSLLPVKLRVGDRIMGGVMSWSRPATLKEFRAKSPFFGLETPDDVVVHRQVLAQPSLDLDKKTWARLSDGTPLVTAQRQGQGWLVLIHTTANTSWSNLPLSGLFVAMLRRIIALSQGTVAQKDGPPLVPLQVLDGKGKLQVPQPHVLPIASAAFERTQIGPKHPPGFYGAKSTRRALNLSPTIKTFAALGALPSWVRKDDYQSISEIDLRPLLFSLAMALLLADLIATLILRGMFKLRRSGVVAGILFFILAAMPSNSMAQDADQFALTASLKTRIAYVLTGNKEVDQITKSGLQGLRTVLAQRTAAELGDPIGVNIAKDNLSFFPLLYWPITAQQKPLPEIAVAKLNQFMRNGGTIFIDTRDKNGIEHASILRVLASQLDIPPLVPLPSNHVLNRAFYLLRQAPGRWEGGRIWIERAGSRVHDGVSAVIMGSHDWAAAWAMNEAQRPLFTPVPGGERQREFAYRFGVNVVIYSLTGNYKADQVHLPAIMLRLGK